jgi:hypothetical protein
MLGYDSRLSVADVTVNGAPRATAEHLLAAARAEAEEIRASAHRDAEDIVSAARARMRHDSEIAEGRAAERLDKAEHEALEIQRNAWKLAQAEIDRRAASGVSLDVVSTAAESEARACVERDLLALAIGATQRATRALDSLADLAASALTDLATAASTLQRLLDATPEQRSALPAAYLNKQLEALARSGAGTVSAQGQTRLDDHARSGF